MTLPIITEDPPPRPMIEDENGLRAWRQWRIVAASEIDARTILAQRGPVARGTVFKNSYGETPDGNVRCQSITVHGKPPAPIGGTGMYVVTAEFARKPGSGRKRPDPPPDDVTATEPVYTTETAMVSTPVDHTIEGFPIENRVEEPIEGVTKLTPDSVLVSRWYRRAASHEVLERQLNPYVGRLNDRAWKGYQRGSFMCLPFKIEEEDTKLFLITGRFHYRAARTLSGISTYITPAATASGWAPIDPPIEGWADIRTNKGTRELIDEAATLPSLRYKPIRDSEGREITQPVPLATDGSPSSGHAGLVALVFNHYLYANMAASGA